MRILHTAVEFAPITKAGGLGDMVSSLSLALAKYHEVEVLIPDYPLIFGDLNLPSLSKRSFFYTFLGKQHASTVTYKYENLALSVIRLDSQIELFSTPKIYSHDDTMRFTALSAACAAYIHDIPPVDIVHFHDWHLGLLPGLLKHPDSPYYPKIVFTIHNFCYRGYCSTKLLSETKIDNFHLSNYQLFRDPQTSVMMKGGLYCSDAITTVSPTYAQEMMNEYSDPEIHDALSTRSSVFFGILNGIDDRTWNPETDPHLAENYDKSLLREPDLLFMKKEKNKAALYERLGLELNYSPLMCIISRIVEQKGPEFMKEAILHAMENAYALIIIGTCYNEEIFKQFSNLQESLATSCNIRIVLDYNPSLACLTYAASDMICIPSYTEPCGLTQLIAMRYGTVPLVRKTGGLADTVFPGVNGFTFTQTDNFNEFRAMLSEALTTYRYEPDTWLNLIEEGMLRLSGLDLMAKHYKELYLSLLS